MPLADDSAEPLSAEEIDDLRVDGGPGDVGRMWAQLIATIDTLTAPGDRARGGDGVVEERSEQVTPAERHEIRTDLPGWDTKQRCTCGFESVSKCEQWKHASDELRASFATAEHRIEELTAERDQLRRQVREFRLKCDPGEKEVLVTGAEMRIP